MQRASGSLLLALLVSCANHGEIARESAQAPRLSSEERASERGLEDTWRVAADAREIPRDFLVSTVGSRWLVHADPNAATVAERIFLTDLTSGEVHPFGAVLGTPLFDYESAETATRETHRWAPTTDRTSRYIVALGAEQTVVIDVALERPVLTFPTIVESCTFALPVVRCFDAGSGAVLVGDLAAARTWRFTGAMSVDATSAPIAAWTDAGEVMHAFVPAFESHMTFGNGRIVRASTSGRYVLASDGVRTTLHDARAGSNIFESGGEGNDTVSSAVFSDDEAHAAWIDVRAVHKSGDEYEAVTTIHVVELSTLREASFEGYGCGAISAEQLLSLHDGVLETDATCSLGCPSVRWEPRFRSYDTATFAKKRLLEERVEPRALSYNDQVGARIAIVEQTASREQLDRKEIVVNGGLVLARSGSAVRVCRDAIPCFILENADPEIDLAVTADGTKIAGLLGGVPAQWDGLTGKKLTWEK